MLLDFRFQITAGLCFLLSSCYHKPHERSPEADYKPGEQRIDRLTAQQVRVETLPRSPETFSPDRSTPPANEPSPPPPEITIERQTVLFDDPPPLAPPGFNPDPGGAAPHATVPGPARNIAEPGPDAGFFQDDPGSGDSRFFTADPGSGSPERYAAEIPQGLELPRTGLRQHKLETRMDGQPWSRYKADISPGERLPRDGVRYERKIHEHWHAGHYEHADYPPFTTPMENRWEIPTGVWHRYPGEDTAETPYEQETPYLWHPYFQSKWKGDIPILGQDVFAALFVQNNTNIEFRSVPTPSAVSTARPGNADFYGEGDQTIINANTGFQLDIFRGETSFKPVEFLFRMQPVFNVNHIATRETTIVSPDPRGLDQQTAPPPDNSFVVDPADIDILLDPFLTRPSTDLRHTRATERTESYWAFQQLFLEVHLFDLSDNYDFAAFRAGTQIFNADFRGHVFFESNVGYRIFGNFAKNRIQYNIAYFDLLEKETFSELNTWTDRNQDVLVANIYFQDFITLGYTTQLNFLANWDHGGLEYDSAGAIIRPTPIGTVIAHDVDAYYLGWNGEGHFGRLNLSHSLYHTFGKDEFNGIAGRPVDISAWMAALELSVDTDWMRHKFTLFYASGDGDATDGKAQGWDSVVDAPNFIGGPFSYWNRQNFNLGGTAVFTKQRLSLLPNLRTSKFQGQSNFVNPGIFIVGVGEEWEIAPKTRLFGNINYLKFIDTDSISNVLVTDGIDEEIGWDLSLGIQNRPLLTDNLVVNAGVGVLIPGSGYRDIYRTTSPEVDGFTPAVDGEVDDFLYSASLNLIFNF